MILRRLNSFSKTWEARKLTLAYRKKIRLVLSRIDNELVRVDKRNMSVRQYLRNYNNTDWHVAYTSMNGIFSPDYLPEDIYYTRVEPALNDRAYGSVYDDKSCLGFLLEKDDYIGNAFFYNHGILYDHEGGAADLDSLKEWMLQQDEVVLKPSKESGGGRGVLVGTGEEIFGHIGMRNDSFVIQKHFRQHHTLASIHRDSLNTIRMMTLRRDGRISIISALLRFGVGKVRVDNASRGGLYCGINDCILRDTAFNHSQVRHQRHPDSHIAFEGFRIPSWEKIVDLAIRNHKKLTELDIVSWDLTLDLLGTPKIVEINSFDQDINMFQISNGPVFSPHLDYLLGSSQNPYG